MGLLLVLSDEKAKEQQPLSENIHCPAGATDQDCPSRNTTGAAPLAWLSRALVTKKQRRNFARIALPCWQLANTGKLPVVAVSPRGKNIKMALARCFWRKSKGFGPAERFTKRCVRVGGKKETVSK